MFFSVVWKNIFNTALQWVDYTDICRVYRVHKMKEITVKDLPFTKPLKSVFPEKHWENVTPFSINVFQKLNFSTEFGIIFSNISDYHIQYSSWWKLCILGHEGVLATSAGGRISWRWFGGNLDNLGHLIWQEQRGGGQQGGLGHCEPSWELKGVYAPLCWVTLPRVRRWWVVVVGRGAGTAHLCVLAHLFRFNFMRFIWMRMWQNKTNTDKT